jgi:hypothetical protein
MKQYKSDVYCGRWQIVESEVIPGNFMVMDVVSKHLRDDRYFDSFAEAMATIPLRDSLEPTNPADKMASIFFAKSTDEEAKNSLTAFLAKYKEASMTT